MIFSQTLPLNVPNSIASLSLNISKNFINTVVKKNKLTIVIFLFSAWISHKMSSDLNQSHKYLQHNIYNLIKHSNAI